MNAVKCMMHVFTETPALWRCSKLRTTLLPPSLASITEKLKFTKFFAPTRTLTTDTTQSASSKKAVTADQWRNYLTATDVDIERILAKDMLVFNDFLSKMEEQSLLREVEPYMKRLRYEFDHWDNAIHGYRETEKLTWNEENQKILQRVRELAFPPTVAQIAYVHVLDISKEGYIKPHVDAVRFCGDTIAGLCLLSPCVMRLALESDPGRYGDVLLNQRALYIMRHRARYDYTHEVLPENESVFNSQVVPRDRRISVICRNEPDKQD